jgi:hypothetical protein
LRNINPLGITGTPVIDNAAQAIYLDSAIENESGPHHLVFALALKDGSVLSGWPVDVAEALARHRIDFVARDENQRELSPSSTAHFTFHSAAITAIAVSIAAS